MPLDNVSVWRNGHGWSHTTPDEALELFPNGSSSTDKIFLCESCGQYASFVVGDYQIHHFRHPAGSKDCKDKQVAWSSYYQTNKLGFSLPIKIKLDANDIEITIGFLPLTVQQLTEAMQNKTVVTISAGLQTISTLLISHERFSSEHITYVSIGNKVSERYTINYSNADASLSTIWPRIINGFNLLGTLFDGATGKRLPVNADVEISREYYLISKSYYWHGRSDISIERIQNISNGWQVYRVKALRLTKQAAEFFLDFGVRLTDAPAYITLLWPPSAQASHIVSHESDPVIFYHKGRGCVEVWPYARVHRDVVAETEGDIYSFSGNSIQQVLSVSRFYQRTSVLRYIVLDKKQIAFESKKIPEVLISDDFGKEIAPGVYHGLPPDKTITITAPYDGVVEVKKFNRLIKRVNTKGSDSIVITVNWGYSVSVYQGMDLSAEVLFERKHKGTKDDIKLLKRLKSYKNQMIPISHEIGKLAVKLGKLPETKRWLLYQIRRGYISEDSLKRIETTITNRCK